MSSGQSASGVQATGTGQDRSILWPVLLCYGGMVAIAIAVNLPPIYLTTFSDTFGGPAGRLTEQQLGWIGTLLFVGLTSGLLASSPIADRFGAKTFVLLGNALVAGGLALMAAAPTYAVLLLAAWVMGAGAGVLDMILSPIVSALRPHNRTSALNWLHSFYAVGKIFITLVGSLMIALSAGGVRIGTLAIPAWAFGWRALCVMVIAVPAVLLLGFARVDLPPLVAEEKRRTPALTLLGSATFLVTVVLMFLAGATELGMAQWLPAYAETSLKYPSWAASQALTAFAVAMTLGRFAGGMISRHVRPIRLLVGCCLVSALLYLVGAWCPNRAIALAACIVTGLAVSIVWPTMLGITADRFPYGGAMMFGILAAAGNMGGVVNLLIGTVAEHHGLPAAIASTAACPVLMVLLLVWLGLHKRRQAAAGGGSAVPA